MKTSLNWVNRYLARPVSVKEFSEILPPSGFPVEGCDAQMDGDFKLEVEVTSNRPDMLCHIGVAREISAKSGISLCLPTDEAPVAHGAKIETLVKVEVQSNDCSLYCARVIKGVKVEPSPAWLKQALENIGLRSISNVVDVTNFVMFEMGQPLHAFDLNKLSGGQLVVREAKDESFIAIDGSKHTLKVPTLVIADDKEVVAIAGVMGGKNSEVTEATTDILLESALFDALSVRRTSRLLKLGSDSSYRFERCPDPRGVERASRRAAQLILEVAGGTLAQGVIRIGMDEPTDKVILLRPQKTRDLLGLEVSNEEQQKVLESLGLKVENTGDTLQVSVPSRRQDLQREVDLIEEVARLVGMDRIPQLPTLPIRVRATQSKVEARRIIGAVLLANGFYETITPSLVPESAARAGVNHPVRLYGDKGLRKEGGFLRSSVVASLVTCRIGNAAVGNNDLRLFEAAACWEEKAGQLKERRSLAMLLDGGMKPEQFQDTLREARNAVETLIEALAGKQARLSLKLEKQESDIESPFAKIYLNGDCLGEFGVIHFDAEFQKMIGKQEQNMPKKLMYADLHLERLLGLYPPKRISEFLSQAQSIDRELSVVCAEEMTFEALVNAIHLAMPTFLEEVVFVDAYRNIKEGAFPGPGKKSISLRLLFCDPARTLRREEVDEQVHRVIESLKKVGALLRA